MIDVSDLKYNIKNDLESVLEAENKNINDFSDGSRISRSTIYEIQKKGYTTDSVYEKFYSYVYNLNYRLNSIKEDFLKESSKEKVLFHGSKFGLTQITEEGSRGNCDFGNGFYLGETYDQALSFVCEYEKSSVYSFICDVSGLKVNTFDCSIDWMLAICFFRGSIDQYSKNERIRNIVKTVAESDVIIAPIADNKMFYIMSLFANGDINSDTAFHSLSASKLGMQYIFKTERALENLKPIEKYYLCKPEKEDCQKRLNERSAEIETKLKLAKREYRDGLYIEELLK